MAKLTKRMKSAQAAVQPGKIYGLDEALKIVKDNAKAKFLLGWRPRYDLRRMADEAWSYQRVPGDPRVIWYPG